MKNGCIPFDSLPFISSPIGHNPRLGDLFACIDSAERKHEILARLVRNNTEIKGQLFTPVKDIVDLGDISALVSSYNTALWYGHRENSKLVIDTAHIFINSYKNDTCFIIAQLGNLATIGVRNYSNSVKAWLSEPNHGVDCSEKKEALARMFENSRVALVLTVERVKKNTSALVSWNKTSW